jgi:hypothetical protein
VYLEADMPMSSLSHSLVCYDILLITSHIFRCEHELKRSNAFLENNNFSDQIKEIYITFQIAIWFIVIIPQSQFFVTEFLFNIYLATCIDGDKTINYESSFVLVKQHSIFSFYINRYSKLLPLPPPTCLLNF